MTEPTTTNIGLIVPNTGDLPGAWGTAALNPNFNVIDGVVGGVLSLSLSAATTITLTTASATLTPGAGPYQSANFQIVLSGTLSGNQLIQLPQTGRYMFVNNCVTGTSVIQIAPATGTGTVVALPPGEQWQVSYDGTNVRLYGLPHVGTLHDFCMATTPAWMNAFSVPPYLLCNGAIFTASIFPALAAYLGSTFGGNGITTFGVPDAQNRVNIPLDFGGNNRITPAVAGIDGTLFGAAGGDQNPQAHTHAATSTVTDPGHTHQLLGSNLSPNNAAGIANNSLGALGLAGLSSVSGYVLSNTSSQQFVQNSTTSVTVATQNATTFPGASGNVQPAIVGGIRVIKT